MVLDLILQVIALPSILIILLICVIYCVYKVSIGAVIDCRRRARARDINDFLNNEFRRLYHYEFGMRTCFRWQIGVLQCDDSWDFCNYFCDAHKNLIEEYKRLTKNEDRL